MIAKAVDWWRGLRGDNMAWARAGAERGGTGDATFSTRSPWEKKRESRWQADVDDTDAKIHMQGGEGQNRAARRSLPQPLPHCQTFPLPLHRTWIKTHLVYLVYKQKPQT